MDITRNTLYDSVAPLKYGQARSVEDFYTYEIGPVQPSSWIDFPSPTNKYGKYKYVSAEFNMLANAQIITRSTYGILDWLGDIGGLNAVLSYLCGAMIAPFATFTFHRTMLTSMFLTQIQGNSNRTARINKNY